MDRKIQTRPTKAFFIEMLTRDIGIGDCVLDLIDNAVSKEIERIGLDVMEFFRQRHVKKTKAKIIVNFDRTRLHVWDNAGGISIGEAESEVFILGNPDSGSGHRGLSVYGIGMKRALFKLGRHLHLRSATDTEEFEMDFDVDAWQEDANRWELDFSRLGRLTTPTRKRTTTLQITKLLPTARERLNHASFERELLRRVSTTYALFLKAGLEISINGKRPEPELPTIISTKDVTPVRKSFKHDGVDITIIAGLTPVEDRTPRGWYVFCNGRLVLEADKTAITGWGDGLPQYRPKFNHFAGIVLFNAKDARSLPWTTTKQGVERDAEVYVEALSEMVAQAKPITNFLSRMYPDESRATDEKAERAALPSARAKSIDRVAPRNSTFRARTTRSTANAIIHYVKPRSAVADIKDHEDHPEWTAAEVGSFTFDYFVKRELS